MPFGILTAQTLTFEPRKPGVYQRAGLALGAPTDEIRFAGASPNGKSKLLSMSATRIKQKDVTVGTTVTRKMAIVTVNVQLPDDGSFTSTEGDSLLVDLNEVITAALLVRLAASEI